MSLSQTPSLAFRKLLVFAALLCLVAVQSIGSWHSVVHAKIQNHLIFSEKKPASACGVEHDADSIVCKLIDATASGDLHTEVKFATTFHSGQHQVTEFSFQLISQSQIVSYLSRAPPARLS